jgi:HK97 family phage prohead protease
MPIPKPNAEETQDTFTSRCMSELNDEYPEQDQRYAICNGQWKTAFLNVAKQAIDRLEESKMERKTFKFEVKSVDDQGIFEGIAAAYRRTPDRANDIIRAGAFKKTISENPKVPSLYMHDINLPIGAVSLTDSPEGLHVKGTLVRGIQKAEEVLLLMKAGIIKTLSIGYDTIQREYKDGVRYLTEVKVGEVSVVIGDLAADDMAIITSVKTDQALQAEPQSTQDLEAANLDSALATLQATADGFDERRAEAAIDDMLSKL